MLSQDTERHAMEAQRVATGALVVCWNVSPQVLSQGQPGPRDLLRPSHAAIDKDVLAGDEAGGV